MNLVDALSQQGEDVRTMEQRELIQDRAALLRWDPIDLAIEMELNPLFKQRVETILKYGEEQIIRIDKRIDHIKKSLAS